MAGAAPAMTVGRVLLAGTGPPAFVLRSRLGPARVAFEVIDKLSEHVEMVAWLVGVARHRRAWRIHSDFVLQTMRKIPGRRVPRVSCCAASSGGRHVRCTKRFSRKEPASTGTNLIMPAFRHLDSQIQRWRYAKNYFGRSARIDDAGSRVCPN